MNLEEMVEIMNFKLIHKKGGYLKNLKALKDSDTSSEWQLLQFLDSLY